MNNQFEVWLKTRQQAVQLLEGLSIEMINTIPSGFNNNIGWNFIHTIATQQHFFYKLSGLKPVIPNFYMDGYVKGTSPIPLSFTQIEEAKALALNTVEIAIKDYEEGLFNNFQKYKTGFGVELTCIEDAIAFNPVHEALHMGYIRAYKRLIQ